MYLLEQILQRCDFGGGEPKIDGLFSCQREELPFFDDSFHLHRFIHHCLGKSRIDPAGFGQSAKLTTHGTHYFFGSLLPGTDHRRGCANRRHRSHEDRIGCQRDHRTCAPRMGVDERVHRDGALGDCFHDLLCGVDPPAGSLQFEDDRTGPRLFGFANGSCDKRRQPELDDSRHRYEVHRFLLCGRRARAQHRAPHRHPEDRSANHFALHSIEFPTRHY